MDKRSELQEEWSDIGSRYLKKNKRGFYDVAMLTGKTITAIKTIQKLKCKKILVLYPDLKIKDSWTGDLAKLGLSEDNYTFSHYMSVKKCIDKYDIVILDEFPEQSEAQLNNVKELVNKLNCYVLGLSGTVSEESNKLAINELLMRMVVQYTAEQAIIDGIISNYQVTVHSVPLNDTKKYLKNSKETIEKINKPIIALKNGIIIEEYISLKAAGISHKTHSGNIIKYIKQKRPYHGFMWGYKIKQ